MKLNPFIVKAKQKLFEDIEIGDEIEVTWDVDPAFSAERTLSHKGTLSRLDTMVRVENDYRGYLLMSIVSVTTVKKIS